MGRQPSLIQGGGGFDALMRCYSAQIPGLTPYLTDHSMPSWRVLISFAGVACAKGGVKKCHPRTEGMNCVADSQDGSS